MFDTETFNRVHNKLLFVRLMWDHQSQESILVEIYCRKYKRNKDMFEGLTPRLPLILISTTEICIFSIKCYLKKFCCLYVNSHMLYFFVCLFHWFLATSHNKLRHSVCSVLVELFTFIETILNFTRTVESLRQIPQNLVFQISRKNKERQRKICKYSLD